jgi:hypothetical protein
MKLIAVIEPACAHRADWRPAIIRQIRDLLGIPVPSRVYRSPPVRIRLRWTDSCGETAGHFAVSEVPERTYEPVKDDLLPRIP